MAPCYSKNGILKGTVDFYCLVCETYLWSEADNIEHIAKSIHKKNLDSTYYVKEFEEDFIRKVKMGYFCELCNKLLPMTARVKIHVKEPSHIDSKNIINFKRIGVNVIAFGKVVLNDKAWNGLNDESCAFCNTEYENEDVHKSLLSHILNIIQIKVEVDENKNMYRKIDNVSFHCLTCNMVLALTNLACHFEEDEHKHLYQECCAIPINEINKNELKEKELNNVVEDQSDKTNDDLAMPVNNTGEDTEQANTARVSDLSSKSEVLNEISAIDAVSLSEVDENEKESKIEINSVLHKAYENLKQNSKDCVAYPLNKTTENKDHSKTVKDNDINKKNLSEKKVKRNKAKINPSESNNIKKPGLSNEICKSKSSFNYEEYEKLICKVLKTEYYITLDENGKTLCILCDWIMDPKAKKIHIAGVHHQTMEKMHKRRLKRLRETERDLNETEIEDNIKNTEQGTSILDMISKFQANNVNINLISNTAICKQCTENLLYDVDAIEEHILKHKNETLKEENRVILQPRVVTNKETSENTSEIVPKENNNEGNAEVKQNEIVPKENNNKDNLEIKQNEKVTKENNNKENLEIKQNEKVPKENNSEENSEIKQNEKVPKENNNEENLEIKENEKVPKENNNDGNAEVKQNEKVPKENNNDGNAEVKQNEKVPKENNNDGNAEVKQNEKVPKENNNDGNAEVKKNEKVPKENNNDGNAEVKQNEKVPKENNNDGNAEVKQNEKVPKENNNDGNAEVKQNEKVPKENNNDGNAEVKQNEKVPKENNNDGNAEVKQNEKVPQENNNDGNAEVKQNDEKLVSDDTKENEPTNEQGLVKIDEKSSSNEMSLKDDTKSEIGEPIASLNIHKQSLGSYIKIFTGLRHMIYVDVIINDTICISANSFNYLLSTNGELKCLICEEKVCNIVAHTNKLKHIKLLNEKPVIINEKTEFVREIHPQLLHCGFCNMTVLSWSEMQDHFKSSSHKEIKNALGWRILMYSTEFKPENDVKIVLDTSELSITNMFSGLF